MSQSTIFLSVSAIILLLWAINTIIPREYKIRRILNIVVMFVVVAGLLNAFGVFGTVLFG